MARLITQLENDTEAGRAALAALWPHGGRAHIVGVTGPSGSGKSTLVNAIAKFVRTSPPPPAPVESPLSPPRRGGGRG